MAAMTVDTVQVVAASGCVCVEEGGVDMGTPHVSIPRQSEMRKTQSSLGNSRYRFKGCS